MIINDTIVLTLIINAIWYFSIILILAKHLLQLWINAKRKINDIVSYLGLIVYKNRLYKENFNLKHLF